jgi:hypothetical protein
VRDLAVIVLTQRRLWEIPQSLAVHIDLQAAAYEALR